MRRQAFINFFFLTGIFVYQLFGDYENVIWGRVFYLMLYSYLFLRSTLCWFANPENAESHSTWYCSLYGVLYLENHVPVIRINKLQELATDNFRVKLVPIVNNESDIFPFNVIAIVSALQNKRLGWFQIEKTFNINRLSRHC